MIFCPYASAILTTFWIVNPLSWDCRYTVEGVIPALSAIVFVVSDVMLFNQSLCVMQATLAGCMACKDYLLPKVLRVARIVCIIAISCLTVE